MKYSKAHIHSQQHIRQIHLNIKVLKLQIMNEIRSLWVIPHIHSQVVAAITDDGAFELDDALELREISEEQEDDQSVYVDDEIVYFQFQELFQCCYLVSFKDGYCTLFLEQELVVNVGQQVN